MKIVKSMLAASLMAMALATAAEAQGRATSSERYPRKKETPARADTVTITRIQTRVDTVYRDRTFRDTLRITETAPAPTFVALNRSGLYFGAGGTAVFPVANLHKSYGNGYGAKGFVGYKMPSGPLGLRVDGGWVRPKGVRYMDGDKIPDANLYFANANLTLDAPVGDIMGVKPVVYALAGVGAHHLKDFRYIAVDSYGRGSFDDESNMSYDNGTTRLSLNAGLGVAAPLTRALDLFVEGQYVTIRDNHGWKTNYVPVTAGLRIFP